MQSKDTRINHADKGSNHLCRMRCAEHLARGWITVGCDFREPKRHYQEKGFG